MRVLHVHSGNLYGGVETMLSTLARRRNSCPQMEPHFALCFEGRLGVELRDSGAPVHRLPGVRVSRPATVVRARRALAALLREESFDVAVCHSTWTQAVFGKVVRASSLPLVFWSHDAPRGTHWLERWARRTPPDFVVCNSHYTARALGSLYPRARAEVVYCPVELPDLTPYRTPESRAAVRAEFDTPSDAAVIIQVSRMEACKGHSPHLHALKSLLKLEGWVCWIVGGGQRAQERLYEERLKTEAEGLGLGGRLRFTGQRSDVARLLAAADIYSQPNTSPESFGLTFIEAMHTGLPVVTTAIGGATEVLGEGCGLLVPPGSPGELVEQLRQLLDDPRLRRRMGQAGQTRARLLCDPHTQVGRLFELLEDVVERPSRAARA
ncbi:MAG: glycosyltransferase family 4 protein [Pyrinomonadaceae bacterium]